jgi:hypothetical protein
MLRMMFEVIQPNLKIERRHCVTLLIPTTESIVRAASGSTMEEFGRILATGLVDGVNCEGQGLFGCAR